MKRTLLTIAVILAFTSFSTVLYAEDYPTAVAPMEPVAPLPDNPVIAPPSETISPPDTTMPQAPGDKDMPKPGDNMTPSPAPAAPAPYGDDTGYTK